MIGVDPHIETFSDGGLPNLSVRKADAAQMPFEEGSVDVCFSTLSFHHMPTEVKKQAFKEVFRILKPGGTFLLTDWGATRVEFLRWLLLFEVQEYLNDHFRGCMPVYAHDAGFSLEKQTRVKPTGIWSWKFRKPSL